jgi:hypothetical protein
MTKRRCFLVLALAGVFMAGGCGTPAARYNNAIVAVTKDLEKAGFRFGQQIVKHNRDQAKLRELHAEFVREIQGIVDRGKAISVPDLPGAQELNQEFHSLLREQELMARDDFYSLVSALPNDKGRFKEQLERIQRNEKQTVARVQEAQRAFAQANNLTLKK